MSKEEQSVFAPAKVNLSLHVIGRRADGYHLLDSLVIFVDFGDYVRVGWGQSVMPELRMNGPEAGALSSERNNMMLRAVDLFGDVPCLSLRLEKHIPLAAGLGGGSADAAATLKAVSMLIQRPLPAMAKVLGLGADVPVCLGGHSAARMEGVGEVITPLGAGFPKFALLLVNPRISIATAEIFSRCKKSVNLPMMDYPPPTSNLPDFVAWLRQQRNDLTPAAIGLAPQIGTALKALSGLKNCLLARMSGSGATVFGIFPTLTDAKDGARHLALHHPKWWLQPCQLMRETT